jgi:predicted  nucleic acid-binding Zn-ribbon protein
MLGQTYKSSRLKKECHSSYKCVCSAYLYTGYSLNQQCRSALAEMETDADASAGEEPSASAEPDPGDGEGDP